MTTLNANTIKPAGSTLTLGASGDTIVANDDVKVNTVKDAGANTLWVSDGSGNLSNVNAGLGGAMRWISTTTLSNSTSAIIALDGHFNAFSEFLFKFISIRPATNAQEFLFQCTTNGSDYNVTMCTTAWRTYHNDANNSEALTYQAAQDQANGSAYQALAHYVGNGADEAFSGYLHLFNPQSTSLTKNYWARASVTDGSASSTFMNDWNTTGFFNTTSALTDIQFKMTSGNLAAGKIKMYGIM